NLPPLIKSLSADKKRRRLPPFFFFVCCYKFIELLKIKTVILYNRNSLQCVFKKDDKKDQEVQGSVPWSIAKASRINIARGKVAHAVQDRRWLRNSSILPCAEEHHFVESASRRACTRFKSKLQRNSMCQCYEPY